MSDLCEGCFPPIEDIATLAGHARSGETRVGVVGDGSPETVIGCGHGSWKLGDLLPTEGCIKPKADGSPCKGRPGDDGLCGSHKDT